jgi:hypothetical protein
MKKNKIQILLLIFITVFMTGLIQPSLLKAEEYYDFGEVEIGSTETIPVIIAHTAPGIVTITLEFDNTDCTDFSVVSAPELYTDLSGTLYADVSGEIEIEVAFTPLQIGSCSNTLTVEGTVDGINIIPTSINLTGIGIEAISDQSEPYDGKVTICHQPPGNPSKPKTIRVAAAAVPAHLDHGDTLGACPEELQ